LLTHEQIERLIWNTKSSKIWLTYNWESEQRRKERQYYGYPGKDRSRIPWVISERACYCAVQTDGS